MTLDELDVYIDIEITEQQMRTYEVIIISTPQGEIEYELSPQTHLNKIYRFIGKGNRRVGYNIADEVGDFCVRFILKKDYKVTAAKKILESYSDINEHMIEKIHSSMYRVIVCDDAENLRNQLKTVLQKCNYKIVAEATNGNEVIDAYFKHKPDLVFLDVTMPNMDGLTALKKIRAKDKNAKVIMCAAMGQQELVIDAMRSGAVDFIIKPYLAKDVFDTLAKYDSVLKRFITL